MINIFSWDRCPDCVRVKVLLGLKQVEYTTTIMTSQRQTDVEKILGKVCVPAIALENDILIDDSENALKLLDRCTGNSQLLVSKPYDDEIDNWLEKFIATDIWRQLMAPRWLGLGMQEFTEDPKSYEIYLEDIGKKNMEQWLDDSPRLIRKLLNQLSILKEFIKPIQNQHISISELNLFSSLIYLTGVLGVVHTENGHNENFPMEVKQFIASVKQSSNINCFGSKAI